MRIDEFSKPLDINGHLDGKERIRFVGLGFDTLSKRFRIDYLEEVGDSSNVMYFEDVFNFKEFRENKPPLRGTTHYESFESRLVTRGDFNSFKKTRGKRTGRDGELNYEDDLFKQ